MRPELHKVEYIEAYIRGNMSPELLMKFQQELHENEALKQQVELQKQLMQAAKRKALRSDIQSVAGGFGGGSTGMKWAMGSGIVLAVAALAFVAFYYLLPSNEVQSDANQTGADLVADSELIDFNGLHTWIEPEVQRFDITTSEGATIKGAYGTLIIVPTDAFVDAQNQLVTAPVELELVEALTLDQMLLYNLTTMSGSKPLGTGGMLHIQATSNGQEVKINPERPLFIQVPTDEVKPDMMLFKGEVTDSGTVDWKDPKPMERYLRTVDFAELDFLPEGMEAAIQSQKKGSKYHASAKESVDSVYYSLSSASLEALPSIPVESSSKVIGRRYPLPSYMRSGEFRGDLRKEKYTKTIGQQQDSTEAEEVETCGIDPLTVKTIRSDRYAQTMVATKPFEERIQYLHSIETGRKGLNQYLKNLSKPMHEIDSEVAKLLTGFERAKFEAFAQERYGNVKDLALYQDQLNAYYDKQMSESRKTLKAKREKLRNASKKELQAEINKLYAERNRQIEKINQETTVVLQSKTIYEPDANASSAPVAPMPIAPRNVTNSPSYAFQWASFGWVNIDQYLKMVAKNPVLVKIEVTSAHEAVQLYQWINVLANLTPLSMSENHGVAAFPPRHAEGSKSMTETHAIAIDRVGSDFFWGMRAYNPYKTEKLTLNLQSVSLADLKQKLRLLSKNNEPLIKALKTEEEELKERIAIEAKRFEREKEWRAKLAKVEEKYATEKRKAIAKQREAIQEDNDVLRELLRIASPCDSSTIMSSDGRSLGQLPLPSES